MSGLEPQLHRLARGVLAPFSMTASSNQNWCGIATLIGVGVLVAVGCAAQDESLGVERQALLCLSVDVCDDGNRCTDDLCIANLCVNEPLLNCQLGSAGAGGVGGEDGGPSSGNGGSGNGKGGSGNLAGSGNAAGTHAGGGAGADATAGAAGGETDTNAVGGTKSGVGGASTADAGESGTADAAAWSMQGGACAFGRAKSGFASAISALFFLGALARARRVRARPGKPQ